MSDAIKMDPALRAILGDRNADMYEQAIKESAYRVYSTTIRQLTLDLSATLHMTSTLRDEQRNKASQAVGQKDFNTVVSLAQKLDFEVHKPVKKPSQTRLAPAPR
jgi:hypothetical protein